MSALRAELHTLADSLPEERVEPVLALVRGSVFPRRSRERGLRTLQMLRNSMHDAEDVDVVIDELRNDVRD